MKLSWVFVSFAAVIVHGQDCCEERNQLLQQRDQLVREKDEVWAHRDLVIREKDEIFHEKERFLQELQRAREDLDVALGNSNSMNEALARIETEKAALLTELEGARTSLDQQRGDMEHYQKVAQDNQKYMQEYKNQLATQRDRAAKLEAKLRVAMERIDELENMTFVKTLKKEVASGWDAIVSYWANLTKKGKQESEF
jgi:chromosome segregation ATPase